jgi:hypothetical protein
VAGLAAAVLGMAATATYAMRGDVPTYGYHRCPIGSVCFFSEEFGTGEMCSWEGDDADWLSGKETCLWTRDRPVKSIFNNGDESKGPGGVADYRGPGFTPVGEDLRSSAFPRFPGEC